MDRVRVPAQAAPGAAGVVGTGVLSGDVPRERDAPMPWSNFLQGLNEQHPAVLRAIAVTSAIAVILVAARVVRHWLLGRVSETTGRYRVRKLVAVLSYTLVGVVVVAALSDGVSSFTVAIGAVGAGIAFALQEVIASMAGWLAVAFGGFYKTGDRVMLGGIKGDVIDIGVLRTTLFEIGDWVQGDQYNGRVVRVANSFVFKAPVFNYSGDFPFLWDEIRVPVRHGSDRVLARRILEEAVQEIVGDYVPEAKKTWDQLTRKFLIEHARVEPMVTMVMDENWMTYTARYVVEFKRRRTTKDAIFERVLDGYEATEGRVRVASTAQEITLVRT